MELTVERGPRLRAAGQNKQPARRSAVIPIDSIYSPVMRVTSRSKATRVEQRTDFRQKLILDVRRRRHASPDAVASAGKTLVELFAWPRAERGGRGHRHSAPSSHGPALAADLALRSRSSTSPSARLQLPQA